jgi:hypothetical protein
VAGVCATEQQAKVSAAMTARIFLNGLCGALLGLGSCVEHVRFRFPRTAVLV